MRWWRGCLLSHLYSLAWIIFTTLPYTYIFILSTVSSLLTITARIISSTYPTSAVTLNTDYSILDNGQHDRYDGLFRGALSPLHSIADPKRAIGVSFCGHPNYASVPNIPNLRERSRTRFETVPPIGQGALVIKHDISLYRLFRFSHHLNAADVQPGEKFRINMNPLRSFRCGW